MHITGLLLMGGYGALRKTAGMVEATLPIYKGMFMLGGAITIISGMLFVFLAAKDLFTSNQTNSNQPLKEDIAGPTI
jgi:glucose dehydrogenase